MFVHQLYTNCLSEAAYYIESNGEAAIIDPLRETEPYLTLAKKRGAVIKYIFETHFHADFVSGHIDLARKTGAKIIYGPNAYAEYEVYGAKDGEKFNLGNVVIEVLHTPGHTLESSCFLLYDESAKPHALFSGDTLFVGDVGRPDLAVKSDISKEDLAGLLYDSIQEKIMPLSDEIFLYPGHGAGSACGKNIGKATHSTLGEQKKNNYALQPMNREEFINVVTQGLEEPPKYFFMDAAINKKGYTSIDEVIAGNLKPLDAKTFDEEMFNGALVLDTRRGEEFMRGFVPSAVNIGLDGQFAVWAGSLLNPEVPLLLVTEPGRERETVLRLARIGFENVKGYLEGGFPNWVVSGYLWRTIPSVSAGWFQENYAETEQVLDIRSNSERNTGIISNSISVPLSKLEQSLHLLNPNNYCYVYCVGGYRSPIACSILRRNGFTKVIDLKGGFNLLKENAKEMVEVTV